jgi:ketosteroid isomerase-like protein
MHNTSHVARLLVAGLFTLVVGCQPATPPDTHVADEQAIRAARTAWGEAYKRKDIATPLKYIAGEAQMFPPNLPIRDGKDSIRATIGYLFTLPGFDINFDVKKVEVAKQGDLAYEVGTYTMTVNDAQGKPTSTPGKYVVVWKKQPDGSWQSVEDIFNADR